MDRLLPSPKRERRALTISYLRILTEYIRSPSFICDDYTRILLTALLTLGVHSLLRPCEFLSSSVCRKGSIRVAIVRLQWDIASAAAQILRSQGSKTIRDSACYSYNNMHGHKGCSLRLPTRSRVLRMQVGPTSLGRLPQEGLRQAVPLSLTPSGWVGIPTATHPSFPTTASTTSTSTDTFPKPNAHTSLISNPSNSTAQDPDTPATVAALRLHPSGWGSVVPSAQMRRDAGILAAILKSTPQVKFSTFKSNRR